MVPQNFGRGGALGAAVSRVARPGTGQGTWKWDSTDAFLKNAARNNIEISGILMGSSPWASTKAHAFPMKHLADWSNYVTTVVGRYKGQVRYWEVWNEGNGGFNDEKHTTTDYANLAACTWSAAKKGNPKAQVGLSVASFDAPYLNQAILTQARLGKADSFDFLCIHPYEIADGVGDLHGEIPYLWMGRTLREMLKVSAPERANADVWMTEVSRRVESRQGRRITEDDAAKTLVKVYTMALAQGIKRTMWFEAQDPVGEDQGFGMLKRDGTPRAGYQAFKAMTTCLGPVPKYEGWLTLGNGKTYAFMFQGASKPVLVAWMPARETDNSLTFSEDVEVLNMLRNETAPLKAGQNLTLTETPMFIVGAPLELIKQARANEAKNFPWGGNYSSETSVGVQLGIENASRGVFQLRPNSTPTIKFPDGSTGILVRGDQSTTYFVHPSFANFQRQQYYVRVTVRRIAPGNVGMNLFYEVADSQGRVPYKNSGQWFGVSAENGWQSHVWHVTDACFSKMWGYDIEFRPEQSMPFVIGKVEVSTGPF